MTLAPGADPQAAATQLRQLLPEDTRVFTKAELTDFEIGHWVTNTSTGIIFGFGVVVAVIVGIVILNQTLSTQIARQLSEFATLKAMGYTDLQLGGIVVAIATILSTVGYLPALLISILIYWIIRKLTPLPIEMSAARMFPGTGHGVGNVGFVGSVRSSHSPPRRPGRPVLIMPVATWLISDFGHWVRRAAVTPTVPLAWRNLVADKRRLLRSTSGVSFAVLLMLIQLGFRSAFLDSALAVIQHIDGDIFITSATKFRFGRKDPFSYRQLYAARAVEGVKWVRPIYGEWLVSAWKTAQTHKIYNVQVLAFDPLQPVFLFPEVTAKSRGAQAAGYGHVRSQIAALCRHGGRRGHYRTRQPENPRHRRVLARAGFHHRWHRHHERLELSEVLPADLVLAG